MRELGFELKLFREAGESNRLLGAKHKRPDSAGRHYHSPFVEAIIQIQT